MCWLVQCFFVFRVIRQDFIQIITQQVPIYRYLLLTLYGMVIIGSTSSCIIKLGKSFSKIVARFFLLQLQTYGYLAETMHLSVMLLLELQPFRLLLNKRRRWVGQVAHCRGRDHRDSHQMLCVPNEHNVSQSTVHTGFYSQYQRK